MAGKKTTVENSEEVVTRLVAAGCEAQGMKDA